MDASGNNGTLRIDVAGKAIDQRFGHVRDDGESADHVSVESAVADAKLALVAGGEDESGKLVGQAISNPPRARAWRFSSVTSSARSLKDAGKCGAVGLENFLNGTTSKLMPRLAASSRASVMLPSEEYWLGMEMPMTFSAPRASTAMTAVRAESMPPLSPTTTLWKPHFWT